MTGRIPNRHHIHRFRVTDYRVHAVEPVRWWRCRAKRIERDNAQLEYSYRYGLLVCEFTGQIL